MNDDLHSRLHALGDSPDLNRPLDDLDVVVRRARARRQRSGRMLAGGVAVALVVVGAAGAVPRLSDDDSQPAVDGIAPDAPPECGLTSEALASDDLGIPSRQDADATEPAFPAEWMSVATTVLAESLETTAEGPWRLTTQIDAIPGPTTDLAGPPQGWTYGTTAVLLQDDAVVAVLDTSGAPTRAEAGRMQVDVMPEPYPLSTEIEGAVISCAAGEVAAVDPGTYELVVSTTAMLLGATADGRVVRATSEPVDVQVSDGSISAGPVACGDPDDELRTLADPQTNPQPLLLSANEPGDEVTEGSPHSFPVTVTNDSPDDVTVQSTTPVVVLTQGGKIVGGLDRVDSGALAMGIPAGVSSEVVASSELRFCASGNEQSAALLPGEYELWVTMSFTPIGPDGLPLSDAEDWEAAGGPWALEIVPATEAGDEPDVTTLTCGTATDELATSAAEESTLTVTPAEPFDADTMTVRITNEGDETLEFTVSSASGGVARASRIVAVGPVEVWDSAPTVLAPGDSTLVTAEGLPLPGCEGELPGGPYDAWVMVTTYVDGAARSLVAGPTDVELPAASGDLIDGYRCGATDHLLTSYPLADEATYEVVPLDLPSSLPYREALDLEVRLSSIDDQPTESTAEPQIYIVQEGLIVAESLNLYPAHLGPIESGGQLDVTVHSTMTACTGPGAPLPPGPLPEGNYQVFVSNVTTSGGPWSLEITAP